MNALHTTLAACADLYRGTVIAYCVCDATYNAANRTTYLATYSATSRTTIRALEKL